MPARRPAAGDQEAAIEALRESLERYRLVGRAVDDTIWDWNVASGGLILNEAGQRLFGYPAGQAGAIEDWFERVHPEDRERVHRGLGEALQGSGDGWSDEYRFRQGDGAYAMVLDRGYILRDAAGRPVRMVGSMIDITGRKRAEEAQRFLSRAGQILAASLEHETTLQSVARLAVTTLADCCSIYLVGDDGRIHRATVAHVDSRKEEILRASPPPEVDLAREDHPLVRGLRTASSELVADYPAERFAALTRCPEHRAMLREVLAPRSVMVVPLLARGKALGAIVFVSSESGRRYDAHDLALAEELVRRAALALDNARLYAEAQRASKAKSDFLAVISHEFRAPLTAVIGYTDLLDTGVAGAMTALQKRHLGHIRASAWHLLRLIEEILVFSRMEAGREELRIERVDVGALVREAGGMLEAAAATKGIELRLHLPETRLEVETDSSKLRQILLNLLSNAVKFTDGGAVDAAVRLVEERIVFEVRDTGVGIAPEDLPRIFDPFWQADRSVMRTKGGTGLGLTVTQRLARLLEGEVAVESRPGGGSTFRVSIPARRGAELAAPVLAAGD